MNASHTHTSSLECNHPAVLYSFSHKDLFTYNHKFKPDKELSVLLTKLWELDHNKCHPGVHYEINLQGYVTSARNIGRDRARYMLFDWLDEAAVFSKETYIAFRELMDNYELELGEAERVTRQERQENWNFLKAICGTEVIRAAHQYLVSKGIVSSNMDDFIGILHKLWFQLIRRTRGDRDYDSSSFEHVFVGEKRGNKIMGLHNWLQLYLLEKAGKLDYHGYFRRETLRDDYIPRLLALQFSWDEGDGDADGVDAGKALTSTFLGSSPEFEIAVYTVMRLLDRTGQWHVQMGEYEMEITVYAMGAGIGSAFMGGARV